MTANDWSETFGGLPKQYAQYEGAAVSILPVPYDGTSTWMRGSRHGPQAILDASANMELYDIETDTEVYKRGLTTMPPVPCPSDPREMVEATYQAARRLLEENKFLVGLGGEHTISVGLVRAVAEVFPNLSVLQLDAHSDTRDDYEGERYNHACVMARIGEICPFVQVGIRSMAASERTATGRGRTFFAHDMRNGRDVTNDMVEHLTENVYVTVDLDVLDPSIMPSTGTPEPGGLDWSTLNRLIASVVKQRNVVALDVTELCPNPSNKAPDFLAAKLIYRILSMVFEEKSGER